MMGSLVFGWSWSWQLSTLSVLAILAGVAALAHLLLHHRDYRSAAFWVALVVLSPLTGSVLYVLFGINSIRRHGRRYRGGAGPSYREQAPANPLPFAEGAARPHPDGGLAMALDRISRFNFTAGNDVQPLCNGDAAMPLMLEAIQSAKRSISLASYIFEATGIGAEFVQALAAAVARGVEVRVMVDDAGTRYAWPPVTRALRKVGVPVQRFMPNRFLVRLLTMNLRNHRKLLIIDGKVGFTGGLNIRDGTMLKRNPGHPVCDLHFRIMGPVVAQMQRVFAEDWVFCSGESLGGDRWFPQIEWQGRTHALGIVDGPDEDMEIMPVALFAALNAARHEVRIVTPYFLPPPILMASLKLCATRGVKVTIITPEHTNIPIVTWAARTLFPDLLDAGCRVFLSAAPFDHSKLLLIDDAWSCVGSTNWDPRSLRLNFEFNIVCHDPDLTASLQTIFDDKLADSRKITLDELDAAPLGQQLRNGFSRLFIPFL